MYIRVYTSVQAYVLKIEATTLDKRQRQKEKLDSFIHKLNANVFTAYLEVKYGAYHSHSLVILVLFL